jgi:hypothetical protein
MMSSKLQLILAETAKAEKMLSLILINRKIAPNFNWSGNNAQAILQTVWW